MKKGQRKKRSEKESKKEEKRDRETERREVRKRKGESVRLLYNFDVSENNASFNLSLK